MEAGCSKGEVYEAAGTLLPLPATEMARILDGAVTGLAIQRSPSEDGETGAVVNRLLQLVTGRLAAA